MSCCVDRSVKKKSAVWYLVMCEQRKAWVKPDVCLASRFLYKNRPSPPLGRPICESKVRRITIQYIYMQYLMLFPDWASVTKLPLATAAISS